MAVSAKQRERSGQISGLEAELAESKDKRGIYDSIIRWYHQDARKATKGKVRK